jgi:hypothetical protein
MRFLLIRNDEGAEAMIPESALPAEKKLHDVLTQHPGLLPADDLRLRDPVVVGREANLESGYADLVLVDQVGQICLVEVKNEGNPDARRVIAQLLGPALRLVRLPARVIAFAERGRVGIVVKPPKGFPPEPFQTAVAEIDLLGLGVSSADEREHSVRYDSATEPQLTAYLAIAAKLLRSLTPNLHFAQMDPALVVQFERNDNVIWIRSVSALAPYAGKWLRGSLGEKGGLSSRSCLSL